MTAVPGLDKLAAVSAGGTGKGLRGPIESSAGLPPTPPPDGRLLRGEVVMGRYVHYSTGPQMPYVRFPEIPPAPPGSKGGVIRPQSSLSIPLRTDGPTASGLDRNNVENAPPPPWETEVGEPLPGAWFPQHSSGRVDHD